MFGILIDPFLSFWPKGAPARAFKDIRTINTVELYFRSPYVDPRNHWGEYWRDEGGLSRMGYPQGYLGPCMRTAVDYVALAAFPYLKHIKNVKLSGAVKSTILKKWKHLYDQAYIERNLSTGFPIFDWEEEIAKLFVQRIEPTKYDKGLSRFLDDSKCDRSLSACVPLLAP
ncbi:hypothetical protein BU23DRAFT_574646 [Bimuria novae-zelandiae CBS 107.79]|uniref:Uncharacterized protein n=1 Tax=Bimuria novae-zelandiae CBS 107.79 TaxID=1447943 RepID=A0A6A5US17_9PLEO|nr:hypothetical protein BU23DRAFT_574646 [Bimuria novae-zelandiae CBS 107.79]